MTTLDLLRFSGGALRGHRLRSALSLVGVAIGVTSVIVLTSLGEGARRYLSDQFTSLGTNLIVVVPGKTETTGMAPIAGGVPRDLTLEDARALRREVHQLRAVAPLAFGEAPVRHGQKQRQVTVVGTTEAFPETRRLELRLGRYLPEGSARQAAPVCVIGTEIQRELFGDTNPLGEFLRVGDERFRVIGVMAPRGMALGMDMDDIVHVPVRSAMRLFNQSGLSRIFVDVQAHEELESAQASIARVLRERHRGEEDFTLLTQKALLSSFGRILLALTSAIAGIAAISLSVAGIGIMNVMLVSVSERRSEIGLLRALGASRRQVLLAFLTEATILSAAGGLVGLATGWALDRAFVVVYPGFPVTPPAWAVVGALALSLLVGVAFGILPARRAARLDPVVALEAADVRTRDLVLLVRGSIAAQRLRSGLTMLGIAIGIASVILLTSIGEGTRQYVLGEFTQFGTNVIAVNPGKAMTTGQPGSLGGTYRKLTLEDAEALRRVPGVLHVVPVVMGTARVQAGDRSRSVFVYGVNSEIPLVWKFEVRQGRFLPEGDPRRGSPVAVLGPKLKREIFGEENALGRYVRIGGQRFLVIGVMAPKGLLLGFDIDDSVYIPVSRAGALFDEDGLLEIDLTFAPHAAPDRVAADLRRVLIERHDGEDDFTVTTQTEMLDVLGNVMNVISAAAAGIGAISLVVGAIGILTVMWISVNERTTEIGLAKAIGAGSGQILRLFLLEAALLSTAGGATGVAAGMAIAALARALFPGLPVHTPPSYAIAALVVSLAVGLASGVLPARRAAGLDPVLALHAE